MTEPPKKIFFGETRRGGTIRRRTSLKGKRVEIYQAICDECNALGPDAVGAQTARKAAVVACWTVERKMVCSSGFMESRSFQVLCPVCSALMPTTT